MTDDPKLILRCAQYQITTAAHQAMMEVQQNQCAICDKLFEDGEDVIDHCHATNVVRGLLCSPCNLLLGRVEAVGIDRLTRYLEQHANIQPGLDDESAAKVRAIRSARQRERLHERFPTEEDRRAYYKAARAKADSKVDKEARRKKDRERKARHYAENREAQKAYQREWAASKRAKDLPCVWTQNSNAG